MSRSGKIFLGIITILPFVFFIFYIGSIFMFAREFMFHQRNSEDFFFRLWPSFVFIGLLVIAKIGLLIYYIIHAVNNKQLDSTERLVWILIFIFVGMIGYPIYWYLRIWRDENRITTAVVQ